MMSKSLLLLITGCFFTVIGISQNIYTKAGTSNPGDYLPATSAEIIGTDIAIDASGNIYVADYGFNRIRKINAVDGTVVTIAGTGLLGGPNTSGATGGFSGDGGPATRAKLYFPQGVAVDAAGNVYFSDAQNNRIRKINAKDGIINTIAGNGNRAFSGDGGAAINSELSFPGDIVLDASGNIYVNDRLNRRIRKINAADGKINTIAGSDTYDLNDGGPATQAGLNNPEQIAVDAAGNLYIADGYNYRIRKVNASDGKINTITGNGTMTYTGDGTAVDAGINIPKGIIVAPNNDIYFSDLNEDSYQARIYKITAADGMIRIIGGTGMPGFEGDGGPALAAKFSSPGALLLDKTGNLFINDAQNSRIRKINAADQIVSTVAGNGSNNSSGSRYPVGDGGAASLATFNTIQGLGVDAANNIYISDGRTSSIRKINAADGTISTFAGTGISVYPNSPDGGLAKATNLVDPRGMIFDKAGNAYFPDGSRVRKIDAVTGVISNVAGNGTTTYSGDNGLATAAGMYAPYDLAFDSKGNLYIADLYILRVRKVDMITGIITTVIGTGSGYRGTVPNGDGGLATAAKIKGIRSLVIDKDDNIYLAEDNGYRIRKVNASDGMINTIAGTGSFGYSGDNGPATAAKIQAISGLAMDAGGNLFLSDMATHNIRKVDKSGVITTIAGNGTPGFSGDGGLATLALMDSPSDIVMDANGTLLIADLGNRRVRYICNASGLTTVNAKDSRIAYPEDSTKSIMFQKDCSFIGNVSPVGDMPVMGQIEAKVWIESNTINVNGQPFVQRHYNVVPTINPDASTANVELYFTQSEFDAYNASAAVTGGKYLPLPSNENDAAGIPNIRIVYKSGASNNNTGLPASYTGMTDTLTAIAEWDAVNNWWKVSFSAKGFGGFFVSTERTPIPAAHNLFVPNMFSPNGDGKNDILMVFGNHIASSRLQIFNQWGQRIFETRNAQLDGWDGRAGGKNQPTGVYVYMLEVKLDDGTVLQRKGSISLIR